VKLSFRWYGKDDPVNIDYIKQIPTMESIVTAGVLLEDKSMDELLDDFVKYVVEVASGKFTNNEKNGFKEIAIFKTGVTL